jgi:hypothetical protein
MRALCFALAALAACTPYDPSLPDAPFLCATDEPRCPDGFVCVTDPGPGNTKEVCRRPDEIPPAAPPQTTSP